MAGRDKESIHHNSSMLLKTSALLIWAAVAGAAVFWGLRLFGTSPPAPPHAQAAPAAAVVRADLARILGPDPAPVAATPPTGQASPSQAEQARFQLLGVIATGSAGWAAIAVDGKPARTYRVGQVVDGSSVLQKVAARGVEIGPRGGAPTVSLQLSPLAPAATGRPGAALGAPLLPLGATSAAAAPAPPEAPAAVPAAAAPGDAPPVQIGEATGAAGLTRRPGVATR